MSIEVSLAIIAIAFIVLAVFLICLVILLGVTLKKTNLTLDEMRNLTQNLGSDVQRKIEAFNPFFNGICNIGKVWEQRSAEFKHSQMRASCADREERRSYKAQNDSTTAVADIVEFANLGVRLWQKIKNKE